MKNNTDNQIVTKKRKLSPVYIAILPLCISSFAYADEKNETIIVTAKPIQSPTGKVDGYVATRSTSATKTNTALIETPQAVSVVTRDEITAHNAQTVSEALRYTSGVLQTNGAAASRFDNISIRGFNVTSTGMLRDGLRSTTAQAWPKVEPYGLERIDVIRGPSSVLYGQNSPGGIVNQVTKRPLYQPFHEVEIQHGNFDRNQFQADFSGPVNDSDKYFYRLTGMVRKSDTQIKHINDDKVYIAPAFTWLPNDNTTFTILADYSHDEFGAPRPFLPLAGTLLPNPNGKVNPNVFLDEPGLKNDRKQASIGYQLDHNFNDILSGHSAARFSHTDLNTNIAQGLSLLPDMRTLNRAAYYFRIKGDVYSLDNNLNANWWVNNTEMTSLVGIDYRHTREDYLLMAGKASPIDIFDPNYGGSYGPVNNMMSNTLQTSVQVGIYAQQQAKFDNGLILVVSGREDWSDSKTQNRKNANTTEQRDSKFTYRTAAMYLTEIGLAPYVSYSTSFNPQLGVNFYGNNYKPITAKQIEAGIKYQPENENINLTLTAFELKQQNMLTTDPDNNLNSIQIGEVRSRGIELQGVYMPIEGLNLTAAYTYNQLENTKTNKPEEKGQRPTGLPEHTASAWADYTIQGGQLQGLGFGAGVRYTGSSPVNTDGSISNPSTTLVDAAAHYDLGGLSSNLKNWRLGVNVTNLTDKQYYTSCSMGGCSVGFDRTIIGSLRYRW
ncbi:TonB-dependent siderophore receptor [Providencia burhodogranariea]|uniref:TonB-dependent outermembrane enantio-pyochelin receptor n=1 Tax=Providencia burhodogranariea DSM 19968 TaxID=1141662 RepID=K8VYP2_9GAMM|nr:TonB-dependent outermembrane enantio-pyochelin receptor [Providencia burhodogranariea DSM 19968]